MISVVFTISIGNDLFAFPVLGKESNVDDEHGNHYCGKAEDDEVAR